MGEKPPLRAPHRRRPAQERPAALTASFFVTVAGMALIALSLAAGIRRTP
jgi:hypothetical protein